MLVGPWARVCAREDRRGGLTPELVDGELCIRTSSQRVRVRLDERLDERSVLVERRPVVGAVLLEGEREVGTAFQLLQERTERAKRKSPQGTLRAVERARSRVDLRRLRFLSSLTLRAPVGHAGVVALRPDLIVVPQRGHGRPLRRCACALPGAPSRRPRIRRCAASSVARSSASVTSARRRHGETRACQSDSAFQRLPMPATRRWSSKASPTCRCGFSAWSRSSMVS